MVKNNILKFQAILMVKSLSTQTLKPISQFYNNNNNNNNEIP